MPLYFLGGVESSSPWNDVWDAINRKNNPRQFIEKQQEDSRFFIIARWKTGDSRLPSRYLALKPKEGGGNNYEWKRIEAGLILENPVRIKSSRVWEAHIRDLRNLFESEHIGLIYWVDPKSDFVPDKTYVLARGPGEVFS
jgi:hypothetical protein